MLFGCSFPSGEQSIEPGHTLSLFKNGFQMQKSRNAEVADMHQRKCPLTLQIDFAPARASKHDSETSDVMNREIVHKSVPLALAGKIHNLALHKPWSAFNADRLTFLTRLGEMAPYHHVRQPCS